MSSVWWTVLLFAAPVAALNSEKVRQPPAPAGQQPAYAPAYAPLVSNPWQNPAAWGFAPNYAPAPAPNTANNGKSGTTGQGYVSPLMSNPLAQQIGVWGAGGAELTKPTGPNGSIDPTKLVPGKPLPIENVAATLGRMAVLGDAGFWDPNNFTPPPPKKEGFDPYASAHEESPLEALANANPNKGKQWSSN